MRAVGIADRQQIVKTMLGELVSSERVDDLDPELTQSWRPDEHEQRRNGLDAGCQIAETLANEVGSRQGVRDLAHECEYRGAQSPAAAMLFRRSAACHGHISVPTADAVGYILSPLRG